MRAAWRWISITRARLAELAARDSEENSGY